MAQNIKSFRNTLNAKFVIATENVKNTIITYFSYLPIDINSAYNDPNQLLFSNDVEQEKLGVAVNELHTPAVLNKEFKKLYNALLQLLNFLNIQDYLASNAKCFNSFCWSWEATSCYKLSLPVIKTCTINPISYLEASLNSTLNYAPTTKWGLAVSDCCKKKT
jgi:hypothetical protein